MLICKIAVTHSSGVHLHAFIISLSHLFFADPSVQNNFCYLFAKVNMNRRHPKNLFSKDDIQGQGFSQIFTDFFLLLTIQLLTLKAVPPIPSLQEPLTQYGSVVK